MAIFWANSDYLSYSISVRIYYKITYDSNINMKIKSNTKLLVTASNHGIIEFNILDA